MPGLQWIHRLERRTIPSLPRGSSIEQSAGSSQPSGKFGCSPGFGPILQCAFPDGRNSPAGVEKRIPVPAIAHHVGVEFGLPEIRPGRRRGRVPAPCMAVPETAVNEADCTVAPKDQIGRTGKPSVMKTIPKSARVQFPAQDYLGTSVLAADAGHHARPNVRTHRVCHCRLPLRISRDEFHGIYGHGQPCRHR